MSKDWRERHRNDNAIEALNKLSGEDVPFDHPVPPRIDKYKSYWCPVCRYGILRDTTECPGCGQEISLEVSER